mmetsp:Transcript_12549/g.45784  ORF Transcript_12549/g.45784 Transcript_12549/m.45784 type:complete len:425 (-) Transcript_12549:257-1531(-)
MSAVMSPSTSSKAVAPASTYSSPAQTGLLLAHFLPFNDIVGATRSSGAGGGWHSTTWTFRFASAVFPAASATENVTTYLPTVVVSTTSPPVTISAVRSPSTSSSAVAPSSTYSLNRHSWLFTKSTFPFTVITGGMVSATQKPQVFEHRSSIAASVALNSQNPIARYPGQNCANSGLSAQPIVELVSLSVRSGWGASLSSLSSPPSIVMGGGGCVALGHKPQVFWQLLANRVELEHNRAAISGLHPNSNVSLSSHASDVKPPPVGGEAIEVMGKGCGTSSSSSASASSSVSRGAGVKAPGPSSVSSSSLSVGDCTSDMGIGTVVGRGEGAAVPDGVNVGSGAVVIGPRGLDGEATGCMGAAMGMVDTSSSPSLPALLLLLLQMKQRSGQFSPRNAWHSSVHDVSVKPHGSVDVSPPKSPASVSHD